MYQNRPPRNLFVKESRWGLDPTRTQTNTSRRDQIIEVQTHNVKPDSVDKYIGAHKALVEYINANKERLHCEAVGNFVVFVGDEDQFIHVWRFDEGYRGIDKTLSAFHGDQGGLFPTLL